MWIDRNIDGRRRGAPVRHEAHRVGAGRYAGAAGGLQIPGHAVNARPSRAVDLADGFSIQIRDLNLHGTGRRGLQVIREYLSLIHI